MRLRPLFPALLLVAVAASGCLAGDDDPFGFGYRPNFAEALLWTHPAEVVVQFHYVEGRAPSDFTLERIKEELWAQTHKEAVTLLDPVRIDVEDESSDRTWTAAELYELHRAHFTLADPFDYMEDDQVFLHYLFLNGVGELSDGRGFVGLQAGGPLLVVLPDATKVMGAYIRGDQILGPPHPAPEQGEASIAIHELGHAFGLVGREAPETADRRTSEEGDGDACECHSQNRDSVMYPGVEGVNPVRFIQEEAWVQHRFDAIDLADIAALRNQDPTA